MGNLMHEHVTDNRPMESPRTKAYVRFFKGELNPKIKLDLNDSFFTLYNKYNPHIL